MDGELRGAGGGHPPERFAEGVVEADRRWASSKRQIIEGVIGQLKDFFGLERHRAKTLGGLLRRLAAKVVAYTCTQRINDSSTDRCATWRTCWSNSFDISRLRSRANS